MLREVLFMERPSSEPAEPPCPHPADTLLGASLSADALTRALNAVDYGLVLLAAGQQVLYLNHAAREDLADFGCPLQLHAGELCARQPEDQAALSQALDGARDKNLQRMLSIGATAGARGRCVLSILPMPMLGPKGENGAMLLMARRSQWAELTADAFARAHRLTRAELKVLMQLCAGMPPTEIARAHHVAVSTVRSQIGSLREKTGASSIAELVRRVSMLPPMPPRAALSIAHPNKVRSNP